MLAFGHAFQNIAFLALSANEGLLLTSGRPTISQKLLDIQPSSWQFNYKATVFMFWQFSPGLQNPKHMLYCWAAHLAPCSHS